MTSDSAPKVCGVCSVGQMFNQQLTRPGEELEEEAAEGKVTFVDALASLRAYVPIWCGDSISVMCN